MVLEVWIHLASLRAIPGLRVVRPADANETSVAWQTALQHDGPTALILSRQNLPVLSDGSAARNGAGVIVSGSNAQCTLVATGSEVSVAVEAAKSLGDQGINVNVVSMPSWEMFEAMSAAERETIIPGSVPSISIEAGCTMGWSKYTDTQIGIDRFGASAPGGEVLARLGISVENLINVTKKVLGK